MKRAQELTRELNVLANPKDAEFLQGFFKTYTGGYGAGDKFLGLRVPIIRKVANEYKDLNLKEIEKVLESPLHEHRMAALVIMVNQAKKAEPSRLKQLYELYLKRTDRINNWDLVDISCRDIVGRYLMDKPRQPLYKLAKSNDLWERRIAIVSTWQFIRNRDLKDTWDLAKILINDKEDLIHKAVGWMLREAGKRNEQELKYFLGKNAHNMPRTMLRYSLEKLPPEDKKIYMEQKA